MSDTLKALMIALILAGSGALAGCQEQGPAEEAGANIDDAVDEAGDSIEQAGDDVEDAVDN